MFEVKDCTFYINGEQLNVNPIDVEISENYYDEKYDKPLKFNATKEATFSGTTEFNIDTWLKILGYNWWQRVVVKVKLAFYEFKKWILKLIMEDQYGLRISCG